MLCRMTENSGENLAEVVAAGGIEAVIGAMRSYWHPRWHLHSSSIRYPVGTMLASLAQNPENKVRIVTAGGGEAVKGVIAGWREDHIRLFGTGNQQPDLEEWGAKILGVLQ
eukprot:293840-Rhodomonas_salina.1